MRVGAAVGTGVGEGSCVGVGVIPPQAVTTTVTSTSIVASIVKLRLIFYSLPVSLSHCSSAQRGPPALTVHTSPDRGDPVPGQPPASTAPARPLLSGTTALPVELQAQATVGHSM